MENYTTKPKTFNQKLSTKRERLNLSLDLVTKETNIPFKYLEALEDADFSNLPHKSQVKTLLTNYGTYLNLNTKFLWKDLNNHPNCPWSKTKSKVNPKYLLSWPKMIRHLVILIIVVSILVFLGLKIKQIFVSPSLIIESPQDGSVVDTKQVELIGRSEPEVELIINNEEIFVDESGYFSTLVDLQKGLNLIKITAKKRYSRVNETEIRLLFKD